MTAILMGGENLRRLFAGLCEQTFQVELGIADPPLIDYLSGLLERFVRMDTIFRVRDIFGRRIDQVGGMLQEAAERVARPQRDLHRHIGDFTLFWTGVYPEQLDKLKATGKVDRHVNYVEQGKRSYRIASTCSEAIEKTDDDSKVLWKLSETFEVCAAGLRKVRRQWQNEC